MGDGLIGLKAILGILDLEDPEKDRADENRRQKLVVALFASGLKFKKGLQENSVVMVDLEGNAVLTIRRVGGLKLEGGSF